MKLNKEEIQKIVLVGLLLTGLLYVYFNLLLGGIAQNEAKKTALIADLTPKIAEARKQIKRTAELESNTAEVNETVEEVKALIPEGAPIAWFPPRIGEFLKRQGIEKATTSLTGEIADAELEGFRKLTWTIAIPKVAFTKLGIALAGLENEVPLLEILRIQIESSREDSLAQGAVLNIVTIVK
jgi:hypothetical protein